MEMDEEFDLESNIPPTRLVDGINIKELIQNSSATFEVVNSNVEASLEADIKNYFHNDDFLDYVNLDCIDGGSDDEGVQGAPGNTPFEKIGQKMANITDDGKVKKRVVREGCGPAVEKDSFVVIHYNAYVEYGDEPYDSSYLRGRPVKQKLNEGNFILGLEVAIATMKKGEISHFLIKPDYGYGKLGCPPRIPPDAELLLQVELLCFMDSGSVEDIDVTTTQGKETPTFLQVLKKAESLHVMGNDLYKKNNASGAVAKYRKAVDLLVRASLADEEEQTKQQKLLCKLHINSAICYNKLHISRMACVACRLALEIQPKNAKALFNYGRALMALGDFDQAKSFLKRAQREQRENIEIVEELEKLDKKIKTYQTDVADLSRRMFQMAPMSKSAKSEDTHIKKPY